MTDPVPPPATPSGTSPGSLAARASALLARFDQAGLMVAAGSVAVILIVLLGAAVRAWSLTGFAGFAAGAAIVAMIVAYLSAPAPATEGWPVPGRDLTLLAGVPMAVLSVLNLIEVLFDLDQVDDERGGAVGLVLTIGLAIAAIVVLVGALRSRSISDLAGAATRRADRGTRLAVGGLALGFLAWLVMLTISVFALGPSSSFSIAASVLAVVVLVVGADPAHSWRLPIPAAWIAIGLSVVAGVTLLDLFAQYNRVNQRFGLDAVDSIAFFAHVGATLLILAGGILSAVDSQRRTGAAPRPQ